MRRGAVQFLAFLSNPVLPKIIQTLQPNATLWAAAPATTSNTSWALNVQLADFSIASKPPTPEFTPISFNFFNTTLWCAESYEEAQPLIAQAVVNGFAPPMLSFGPGPQGGGAGRRGGLGDAAGLPEARPARPPQRSPARARRATQMTAVPVASRDGEDSGGDGDEPQPWVVALFVILAVCAFPLPCAWWPRPMLRASSAAFLLF